MPFIVAVRYVITVVVQAICALLVHLEQRRAFDPCLCSGRGMLIAGAAILEKGVMSRSSPHKTYCMETQQRRSWAWPVW